jgi:ABC-2 type transport system ATP-binding protein
LMQQKFFELLQEENKKGATILFSSHILSEVQKLCNRVAIIKEGQLVTVEKISTLKENNYKKIKIETKAAVAKDTFQLDGINKLEVKDNVISFLFRGNINDILKKITEIEITNLWIEEPDLEEIFIHYYEVEA